VKFSHFLIAIAFLVHPFCTMANDLHDAVRAKDIFAVEKLISGGIDINETDYFTGTPIHISILQGDVDLVSLLIQRGADIESESELQGARALHLAADLGELEIVQVLLNHGADFMARDSEQRTPLYRAASVGAKSIVMILLEQGAPLTGGQDAYGGTPLHIAAENGQLEIAKLLLAEGADVNAIDERGFSALSLAAQPLSYRNVGGEELLKVLVESGADLGIKNSHGQTPLEYAESRHSTTWADIVEFALLF
jgi:ankyrin repeat protein